MSFFLGSWGMNRSAEQTNLPRTASRFTRFVCPALRFIPHEPRKKDTHSLIEFECPYHYLLHSTSKLPAWHKASPMAIDAYRTCMLEDLNTLLARETHSLSDMNNFYRDLVEILTTSATQNVPICGFNPHTRPGWTDEVKGLHKRERAMRLIWVNEGRPRGMVHESYRDYKRAKRNFRNALTLEHERYMRDVYRDIDEAADCDIRLFWKLTKRQRPKASRTYPEIKCDNGVVYRDPPGVAEAFASYFESIYSPSDDALFDDAFRQQVEADFLNIQTECSLMNSDIPGGPITVDDLTPVLRKLKYRKAPGSDRVTYEHVIYGGEAVTACLSKLFNIVVLHGKVPYEWKRGLIVPLYKGGDKSKTSCNSYRPVALLSCIFKIFESVLHNRITSHVVDKHAFPNIQQQGFQENLGCLTASFNLQETVYHNLEQGSNVCVSFLDSSKAFDTVWRHGLLFKLYSLGVKGKLWSLIDDCHVDTSSAIVVNQTQSRWFTVQQGVRQGGVLSTFLYLVYINDLIVKIEQSSLHTGILNIPSNCPSLADDLSCIGLTPLSLQNMLNIALAYSRKWRFKFNAQKSCISRQRQQSRSRL